MSEGTHTVVGREKGVLTFDGETVEAYGFDPEFSHRMHVALITRIKVDKEFVSFAWSGGSNPLFAFFPKEEMASREMAALIDAVRAAAPNPEEEK
jgi:hypothetical protein